MNQIAIVLLIIHFLSDFVFQPKSLVENKEKNIGYLMLHSGIYWFFSMLALGFYGKWYSILLYGSILGVAHFIIDHVRLLIKKKVKDKKYDFIVLFVDQIFHILTILLVSRAFSELNCLGVFVHNNVLLPVLNNSIEVTVLLKYILAFIFVLSPASVFVKIFLESFSTDENSVQNEKMKAGATIGKLERIIILILGIMGQYSSIGLVLTAKSIARYNKIAEDVNFAERYLLGTLLSLLLVIVSLIIVKI